MDGVDSVLREILDPSAWMPQVHGLVVNIVVTRHRTFYIISMILPIMVRAYFAKRPFTLNLIG